MSTQNMAKSFLKKYKNTNKMCRGGGGGGQSSLFALSDL